VPRVRRRLDAITVFSTPGHPSLGVLRYGALVLRCALGRGGVTYLKRECDGATPAGRHRLLSLYVRRDRLPGPKTALSAQITRRDDGWCDDPASGRYNCPVRLPSAASHEHMWRDDGLYDLVGVLHWNIRPRIRGRGSAIFLHICGPDFAPTAGCVALRRGDLTRLLAVLGRRPELRVAPNPRKTARRSTRP